MGFGREEQVKQFHEASKQVCDALASGSPLGIITHWSNNTTATAITKNLQCRLKAQENLQTQIHQEGLRCSAAAGS